MSLYRNCKLLFQHEPNQIDCKQTAEPPIPSSVSYLNNMRILYRPILELYDQCKRLETLDLMMLRTPVWTLFTLSLLILSRSLSKPILYTIFRWWLVFVTILFLKCICLMIHDENGLNKCVLIFECVFVLTIMDKLQQN